VDGASPHVGREYQSAPVAAARAGRQGTRRADLDSLRGHRGFVALSAWAVAILLVLTRTSSWFWHDEWTFIRERSLTDPASWFLPHGEHFVAIHAAVYSALVAAFGTTTYLPYLAVTWAAHIAFVAAIYVLVDRHVGRGPALAVAAVLLVLGSAALNLFWAFQMGPIASGAFAAWGLVVIREHPGRAVILMSLGVATGGFALFFIPAAALYGWSRRALLASAVPAVVYGAWYLVERGAMVHYGPGIAIVPPIEWLPGGFVASIDALTGLGTLGVGLFVLALPLLLRVRDRRLAALGILGLLTEYAILGLTRPGLNVPGGWQYVYFGAAFVALVFASAWPAIPRWGRPATVGLAGLAVALNLLALVTWSVAWPAVMAYSDPLCRLCVGP
jgi:hypothetical protein